MILSCVLGTPFYDYDNDYDDEDYSTLLYPSNGRRNTEVKLNRDHTLCPFSELPV